MNRPRIGREREVAGREEENLVVQALSHPTHEVNDRRNGMVNGTRGFKVVGESVVLSTSSINRNRSVGQDFVSIDRLDDFAFYTLDKLIILCECSIVALRLRFVGVCGGTRIAWQMGNTYSACDAQRQSQRKRIQRDTERGTEREGTEGYPEGRSERAREIARRRERAREVEGGSS